MQLHFYQILVSAIALLMIYQGIVRYIKGKTGQTFLKLFVRIIVWGSMVLIAVFPKFTILLAHIIGIEGNINAVILVGFLLIFLMIFKLLSAIERLERLITEITRNDAIKKLTNKK